MLPIIILSVVCIVGLLIPIVRRKLSGKQLLFAYAVFALASLLFIASGAMFASEQGWLKRDQVSNFKTSTSSVTSDDLANVYENSTNINRLFGEKIKEEDLPKSVKFDAPLIQQYPELPRGCEVTSLAMMLQHAGIEVGKMELAEEVKRDTTPYSFEDGTVHFGNPHQGFVGDMYTIKNPGYGVYHEPVFDLAQQYLQDEVKNISGGSFAEVLFHVSRKRPVWIITNTTYQPLPKSSFQTWQTPEGPIDITYREHSVIITGYDEKYIYFNDPLDTQKNKRAPREAFKQAWEQMGKQAITYVS